MRMSSRLVVGVLALGLGSCAIGPRGQAWKPLFDGKTLAGWTPKIRGYALGDNFGDTFRVRDGAIVVSYDKYENRLNNRFGHLFHETPLRGAYRLRLEYRIVNGALPDTPPYALANSGVMIFGQDPRTMELNDSFPVSLEAQLLGPNPPQPRTTGNICSPGTNVVMEGKLITQHCLTSTIPALPFGEWVQFEVEVAKDGTVTQKINGEVSMVYSGVQLDPAGDRGNSKPLIAAAGGKLMLDGGTIALQGEGNPVEFRKIEVLQLD